MISAWSSDVKKTLPVADRLLARFGEGRQQSWSLDKGFSAQQDRELLELYIPEGIMPKKGQRSQADQARETLKTFQRLRRQHSAIESEINALAHHGLNRCPDKRWPGFQRYVGLSILAYNLHKIGHRLITFPKTENGILLEIAQVIEEGELRRNFLFPVLLLPDSHDNSLALCVAVESKISSFVFADINR